MNETSPITGAVRNAIRRNHLRAAVCFTAVAGVGPATVLAQDSPPPHGLEEIIVTASRRAEALQDTPYNLSVFTSDVLQNRKITDLTKLALMVPGATSQELGPDGTTIVIRGLTVSDNNLDGSTVAQYINDTPSNILIGSFKLLDIDRVEVLRGPQGTLYGAGSLGGTVRYITNKPDPTETTVDLHLKSYVTKASDGASVDGDIVINLPLVEDRVALRTVVGHLNEEGFVDFTNVLLYPGKSLETTTKKDLNYERTTSLRASLLANVTDDIEAVASHYFQRSTAGGRQRVNEPFTGDRYAFSYLYEAPKRYLSRLSSLDLTWQLGFADLFSSSSYGEFDSTSQGDVTDFLITLGLGYEAFPFFSGYNEDINDRAVFTQELRLTSTHDGPVQWIAGLFYTDEDNYFQSREFTPGLPEFFGIDRPDQLEYFQKNDEHVREMAAFGEISYDLTDEWTVTGGVRHFRLETDQEGCLFFPLYPGTEGTAIDFNCEGAGTINGVVYSDPDPTSDTFFKFNVDYHLAEDVMAYATFSQGFRRGGVNSVPEGGQAGNFPESFLSYGPDTVDNYELGLKSQFMDGRATLNVAAYTLDWTNLQLPTSTGPEFGDIPITANAGKARSRGGEAELAALVTDALSVFATYSYTDARVEEDNAALGAEEGDPVPNVPETKFTLGFDYSYGLADGRELLFHADGSYNGSTDTAFPGANNFDHLPAYTIVNAAITHRWNEDLSLSLFADNLFNEYAPTIGRHPANNTFRGQFNFINRPRSVGLDLRYSF